MSKNERKRKRKKEISLPDRPKERKKERNDEENLERTFVKKEVLRFGFVFMGMSNVLFNTKFFFEG